MRASTKNSTQTGTTLVESAFMLSFFMLFIMGIFEYGRYIMILQVTTNAARTGARYAAVNTSKPATFDKLSYGTFPSIRQTVINNMGGADGLINSFDVTVYPVDPEAMYSNPSLIVPIVNYKSWNQNTFPQLIGVKVTGKYIPILPGFVFFMAGSNNSIPIEITACCGCES